MALHEELKHLAELHKTGVLNDKEYELAKAKILATGENTVGKAANKFVKLITIWGAVSILLALGFFFFFFLPNWNKMNADMQSRHEQFDKHFNQMDREMSQDFSQEVPTSRLDQQK